MCTTFNTHRSSDGCAWEQRNEGESCVFKHFCSWCKSNRDVEEKHKAFQCEHKTDQQLKHLCKNVSEPNSLEILPFSNVDYVTDFIECRPDISDKIKLLPIKVQVSKNLVFEDRSLPNNACSLIEPSDFPKSYYVDLHLAVKSFKTNNYNGARIPLRHNNINVEKFRVYLSQFNYPHQHILQYIEFGFPLGLWTDAYLVPCTRNHSSSYSYFSFIFRCAASP